MSFYTKERKQSFLFRSINVLISVTFILSMVFVPSGALAFGPMTAISLPAPGTMIVQTPNFIPPMIHGITINANNPLQFDFLVNPGDDNLQGEELSQEALKLIKYFLAALTVPEDELWVNLSPYEKDRIIPQDFGQTEMGRDLLAQDYLLKQLSASLMYPEDELGQKFWNRVKQRAQEEFGTTDIPMNTFNKIWIIPENASVYTHNQTAYIAQSHLKVMLEEDYLALAHNTAETSGDDEGVFTGITSQIVRDILIPEIENEINHGKTFANLRQIFHSVILASWYKENLKESLLGQIYVDRSKTKGIEITDKDANQKIYDQYVEAFKKGVYDYIKEDYDAITQDVTLRKYFSGGAILEVDVTDVAGVNPGGFPKKIVSFAANLEKTSSSAVLEAVGASDKWFQLLKDAQEILWRESEKLHIELVENSDVSKIVFNIDFLLGEQDDGFVRESSVLDEYQLVEASKKVFKLFQDRNITDVSIHQAMRPSVKKMPNFLRKRFILPIVTEDRNPILVFVKGVVKGTGIKVNLVQKPFAETFQILFTKKVRWGKEHINQDRQQILSEVKGSIDEIKNHFSDYTVVTVVTAENIEVVNKQGRADGKDYLIKVTLRKSQIASSPAEKMKLELLEELEAVGNIEELSLKKQVQLIRLKFGDHFSEEERTAVENIVFVEGHILKPNRIRGLSGLWNFLNKNRASKVLPKLVDAFFHPDVLERFNVILETERETIVLDNHRDSSEVENISPNQKDTFDSFNIGVPVIKMEQFLPVLKVWKMNQRKVKSKAIENLLLNGNFLREVDLSSGVSLVDVVSRETENTVSSPVTFDILENVIKKNIPDWKRNEASGKITIEFEGEEVSWDSDVTEEGINNLISQIRKLAGEKAKSRIYLFERHGDKFLIKIAKATSPGTFDALRIAIHQKVPGIMQSQVPGMGSAWVEFEGRILSWDGGVTEEGINNLVRKVRELAGDKAESRIYVFESEEGDDWSKFSIKFAQATSPGTFDALKVAIFQELSGDIKNKLSEDVVVEFERERVSWDGDLTEEGLNNLIRKVREVAGDGAESKIYVFERHGAQFSIKFAQATSPGSFDSVKVAIHQQVPAIIKSRGFAKAWVEFEGRILSWDGGVTEKGLNNLIRTIREVAGDEAESRTYVFEKIESLDETIFSINFASAPVKADSAPGGIDFNSKNMDLKTEGHGIQFSVPSNIDEFMAPNMQGFVPVIINATPVPSLPLLLGLVDTGEESSTDEVSDVDLMVDRKLKYEYEVVETSS